MDEVYYAKSAEKAWLTLRDSNGVPTDPQAKAILVAAIVRETAKDRRMAEMGEKKAAYQQPMKPMTQKQHDFFHNNRIPHDEGWDVRQASVEIDKYLNSKRQG